MFLGEAEALPEPLPLLFDYNTALSVQRRDLPNTVTLLRSSSTAAFLSGPMAKLSNF